MNKNVSPVLKWALLLLLAGVVRLHADAPPPIETPAPPYRGDADTVIYTKAVDHRLVAGAGILAGMLAGAGWLSLRAIRKHNTDAGK